MIIHVILLPPSITRNRFRRSGAVTTGSIGCVASIARSWEFSAWQTDPRRPDFADTERTQKPTQLFGLGS